MGLLPAKHETKSCREAAELRDGAWRWSPRDGEGVDGAVELGVGYVVKAPAGTGGKVKLRLFSRCTGHVRHLCVLASRMDFTAS